MRELLLVCAGGAVGSGARFLVANWATRVTTAVPLGTFFVNVVGSFLLGVVMVASLRGVIAPSTRILLGAGVMGGFTTYSSFNWEMVSSVERGAWLGALLYGASTVVCCLVAGAAGAALTRSVVP